MEVKSISREVMEHARGTLIVDLEEMLPAPAGVTAYQCKLYKTRLGQAAESTFLRKQKGPDARDLHLVSQSGV